MFYSRPSITQQKLAAEKGNELIAFTCVSVTWYAAALQGENIRTFLTVHMSGEAKVRHNLQSPLAQRDAVPVADAHVSSVKPLYARGGRGGAGAAGVHLAHRSQGCLEAEAAGGCIGIHARSGSGGGGGGGDGVEASERNKQRAEPADSAHLLSARQ